MKKIITILLLTLVISICNAQTWENYIKNFPRKSSTVVKDYQGNIIKNKSLGVLNVRINSVQQCADAAIRLRAEYFYSKKEYDKISFKLTSGLEVPFSKWAQGYRVRVPGNKASLFMSKVSKDYSRENFEAYLKIIMTYAGSASLARDLKKRTNYPEIGDLLIIPGYPGHVVIIIDKKIINGVNYYLFANSWIPAQDIEIIAGHNPKYPNIRNYTPIVNMKNSIYINGYNFKPSEHTYKWHDQN